MEQAEASDAAQGHDVFVSYSRNDRETVVRLTTALEDRGKRCWVDLQDIPPSAEWMAEIRRAIEGADGYLVVISPAWARSEVCGKELSFARESGKRIVPVLVGPTNPKDVPETLASLNWIDAADRNLEAAMDPAVEALDTDLVHIRAHTRLLVRASEWKEMDEDAALLLRGSELSHAEETISDPDGDPRPTQLQTRFVLASRKASGHRQRVGIAAVVVALVAALGLSVFALVQRREAVRQREDAIAQRDLARSGDLSSAALAELDDDPEVSLLLSMEAAHIRPTERVVSALRESIKASNLDSVYRGHPGKVGDIDFGPDGRSIVSVGYDGSIRIWDPTTGETRQVFRSPRTVWSLAFDPRGRWVATAVRGGVFLWDAVTGDLVRTLQPPGTLFGVEFVSDGTRIVGGGDAGTRV